MMFFLLVQPLYSFAFTVRPKLMLVGTVAAVQQTSSCLTLNRFFGHLVAVKTITTLAY